MINASKKGIDAFLKLYGVLEVPPEKITFEGLSRLERRWSSCEIEENPEALITDPTPYMAGGRMFNHLVNSLQIQFLANDHSEHTIFVAGMLLYDLKPVVC